MNRALLVLLLLVPLPAAQEKVSVRRLSDVVAVREGPLVAERVLYYFNPTVELQEGHELEQGSGGHSELTLSGGTLVQLFATTHVILERLSPEGDVLRFPLATSFQATAEERPLRLLLPGHVTCDLVQTGVRALLVPGRMVLRNSGSQPVVLSGDLRLEREGGGNPLAVSTLVLERGQQARTVLVAGDLEPLGELVDLWGALPVRHPEAVGLEPVGAELRLKTAAEAAPSLTVRGVRTLARPGLVLHNPTHVELPSTPPPVPAEEELAVPQDDAVPAEDEPPAEAEPPADEPPPDDDTGDEPR